MGPSAPHLLSKAAQSQLTEHSAPRLMDKPARPIPERRIPLKRRGRALEAMEPIRLGVERVSCPQRPAHRSRAPRPSLRATRRRSAGLVR